MKEQALGIGRASVYRVLEAGPRSIASGGRRRPDLMQDALCDFPAPRGDQLPDVGAEGDGGGLDRLVGVAGSIRPTHRALAAA
jgi:hypothetical protein